MSNLPLYIKEIGKTLAPEYGPETPSVAVDRLLKCYLKLGQEDRPAFVAALIGEVVTLKVIRCIEEARERVLTGKERG